ncbi:TPA: hypothetical protein I2T40_12195 [Staphylococcus aureus]|nr:hypothetical protein [Staphylococcus aureus]
MLGPRQLVHYCKLAFRLLLCWGPPTCTLLYAGFPPASMLGPRQLVHYCMLVFRLLLCWGPAIIVKSLLQAYFRSVNYCLYDIVKLWTLIKVTDAYRFSLNT